jgi:hypothetical protein
LSVDPVIQTKRSDGKIVRWYDRDTINRRAGEITDLIAKMKANAVVQKTKNLAPFQKSNIKERLDTIEEKLDRLLKLWEPRS